MLIYINDAYYQTIFLHEKNTLGKIVCRFAKIHHSLLPYMQLNDYLNMEVDKFLYKEEGQLLWQLPEFKSSMQNLSFAAKYLLMEIGRYFPKYSPSSLNLIEGVDELLENGLIIEKEEENSGFRVIEGTSGKYMYGRFIIPYRRIKVVYNNGI